MADVCGAVLREETQDYLLQLFARTVEAGLRFVSKKCVQAIAQVSLLVTLWQGEGRGVGAGGPLPPPLPAPAISYSLLESILLVGRFSYKNFLDA